MTTTPDIAATTDERIAAIERIVCREVGRGAAPLMKATVGNLARMAVDLAAAPSPRVGILTGFFVPWRLTPPMAETDGPVGAAHLAAGVLAAGWGVRVATDEVCVDAVAAALAGADATGRAALDVVPVRHGVRAGMARVVDAWKADGVTHALSIERCGRSRDRKPRNMRGEDVSRWTAPLDDLFLAGDWRRLAIGDGGNEIGMGALPRELIARSVPHGADIASTTPADCLVVAGVSNWGAYGLLAALAVLRPDLAEPLTRTLNAERDLAILERMVRDGPAGDPVAGVRAASVDGFAHPRHARVIAAVRRAADLDR